MNDICSKIHQLANKKLERYFFPYDETKIPLNGIYILFEKGEKGHGVDRIVRIGTHNGLNQLKERLKQHFLIENKDRSIFRKNIGRCILNKNNDQYLKIWEEDLTSLKAKLANLKLIDHEYHRLIENKVSKIIQENFSFCVIEINTKEERLEIESKLISTVSLCNECKQSKNWFGNYSPVDKIKQSGLWQVQGLYKESFRSISEFENLISKH